MHSASEALLLTLLFLGWSLQSGRSIDTEKPGYRFGWVDISYKEVDPKQYDGLVIPGGRAPEYIRTHAELENIVKHFFEAGKPVAAICHGPLVLSAYNLVNGRTLTAYPVLKADMERGGASYQDKEVVVDGNLVTSRAWPDNPAWMKEFMKLVKKRV